MLRRKKIAALFVGIVFTIFVLVFSWNKVFSSFPILSRINNIFYDVNLKLFYQKQTAGDVVIVDVDEKSLAQEGKWPWPRNKIARLVAQLQQAQVAVVAFDILFPESDLNVAKELLAYTQKEPSVSGEVKQYLTMHADFLDNDKILAQVLSQGDVVLGVFFHNELYHSVGELGAPFLTLPANSRLVIPHMQRYTGAIAELVRAAHNTGFVTTIPDDDGILRRSPLFIIHNDAVYPALALAAVRLYLLQDKVALDTTMLDNNEILLGAKLGNIYIPTDPAGNVLIPYHGPAFSFPYVSATDVLHGNIVTQNLAGKLVIIGSSAIGIGDMHSIPLQSASYPGCEVHANIAEAILTQSFLTIPAWVVGGERVLIVVLGVLLSLWAIRCTVTGLFLITVIGELAIFLLQAVLWTQAQVIIPHIILPYFLVLFLGVFNMGYGYLFESRYRNRLHDLYGQYVSSEHIDNMLDNPGQYSLQGHSKDMSVLFADVRGFTSISEKLDANGVKIFLNQLFTPLTKIIFEQKGTIDKYVGDMVMAFWNDPIDDHEHKQHAVMAALQMVQKVLELAPVFAEQGLQNVRIGVGVNSGMMHVGDMGSEYRKTYTVLGDAVNLASRLESSNKFYGTQILVSESTQTLCKNIIFRFIDKVCVKGKKEAINIYEPICLAEDVRQEIQEELNLHQEALNAYYARDWCKARELFEKLKAQYARGIYNIYLARLQDFVCVPPAEDWDGTYTRTEK